MTVAECARTWPIEIGQGAVLSLLVLADSLFVRVGSSFTGWARGARQGADRWPPPSDMAGFPVLS